MASQEEEECFIPLVGQRVFGAGIKRKRIAFVPATSTENLTAPTTPETASVADRYLEIVLKKGSKANDADSEPSRASNAPPAPSIHTVCAVCKQPISADTGEAVEAHESSIVHQLCLEHSHPPSHLDRQHVGLKYLTRYGWDPDSRLGLGARADGIRAPVKRRQKRDTVGIGFGEGGEDEMVKKSAVKKEEKGVRLNATQVRAMNDESRKGAENLRHAFYGQDLEKYGLD